MTRPEREQQQRDHVADVLRGLRRRVRLVGGDTVTSGLLKEWNRQRHVLQAFRRADARPTVLL